MPEPSGDNQVHQFVAIIEGVDYIVDLVWQRGSVGYEEGCASSGEFESPSFEAGVLILSQYVQTMERYILTSNQICGGAPCLTCSGLGSLVKGGKGCMSK